MMDLNSDPRFAVQRIEHDAWVRTTAANAAADYLAGFRGVVRDFLGQRAEPEFRALGESLAGWSRAQAAAYAAEQRGHSLLFLVLMMTGACNADCGICFTDRRKKAGELDPASRRRLLAEARALGARYVYVPGEGEPTIDAGFWDFLEACRENGLQAVVFTNGIVLSDPASCRRYWGTTPEAAAARLAEYPVSFYVKYWSTDRAKTAALMGISPERTRFTERDGTPLPAALDLLMDALPRERVGIEVVVERRNVDEVRAEIVPFAQAHGLARIVEMLQHNGRIQGNGEYDVDPADARAAAPLLSVTSCAMATAKAVVTSRGWLSPRIAVLEHQLPPGPAHVRDGSLYELLHATDYLVERRYDINRCLCEVIPQELAGAASTVRVGLSSVPPAALAAGCAGCPGASPGAAGACAGHGGACAGRAGTADRAHALA